MQFCWRFLFPVAAVAGTLVRVSESELFVVIRRQRH